MSQVWQPEAVIFIGLQGSGKSTFYLQRFWKTHVRINLDMLKTRHREQRLLHTCIDIRQPFVVDNTNVTQAERAAYLGALRGSRFRIVGYFFVPNVAACVARNAQRTGRERIPDRGIFAAAKRLQAPAYAEGFDMLYHVRIDAVHEFVILEQAVDA